MLLSLSFENVCLFNTMNCGCRLLGYRSACVPPGLLKIVGFVSFGPCHSHRLFYHFPLVTGTGEIFS